VAADHMTEVTRHVEVKRGIVVVDGHEVAVYSDVRLQLFAYLTPESLLGRLARLHLATGKLPPVFHLAIATLRGKILAAADDDSGHYMDGLHSFACNINGRAISE